MVVYKIELTREEVEVGITQLGTRITELSEIQKQEAKKENIKRIIELEELLNKIKSVQNKLMNSFYYKGIKE